MLLKIIIISVVALFLLLFLIFIPVGLWISAVASGVKIGIFNLVGMKLRRVKPAIIVVALIKATKAGLDLKVNQLEAHYLAGGRVDSVVNALIAAQRAGISLSFEKASAIDLAGRDVFEAVMNEATGIRVSKELIGYLVNLLDIHPNEKDNR